MNYKHCSFATEVWSGQAFRGGYRHLLVDSLPTQRLPRNLSYCWHDGEWFVPPRSMCHAERKGWWDGPHVCFHHRHLSRFCQVVISQLLYTLDGLTFIFQFRKLFGRVFWCCFSLVCMVLGPLPREESVSGSNFPRHCCHTYSFLNQTGVSLCYLSEIYVCLVPLFS